MMTTMTRVRPGSMTRLLIVASGEVMGSVFILDHWEDVGWA